MANSSHARALLPLMALQGAVGTINGFLGFFIAASYGLDSMFRYTAVTLTAAIAATWAGYAGNAQWAISPRSLLRAGFVVPGLLLLLVADQSVLLTGIAFGAFVGATWGARHALEMSLFADAARDRYAAQSGTVTVVSGILATLLATVALAASGNHSLILYRLYGLVSIAGGLLLGRALPATAPLRLQQPWAVLRQPEFVRCLPLFLLESGLFGIGQAVSAIGAAHAIDSATRFGWIATGAGLIGAIALHLTRRRRAIENRGGWLAGACVAVGAAFMLLAGSARWPWLYLGYLIVKAGGGPFLSASEQVLNQRTLDICGALPDRIFARELVLWGLRMGSLLLFWGLARRLPPVAVLYSGGMLLAGATLLEYVVGRALFVRQPAIA